MSRRLVAEYTYTDAKGRPRIRKVRTEPKTMRMQTWKHGERQGFWVPRIRDHEALFAERAMYLLPGLLSALYHGAPVYWTEGEKDADALRGVGAVATSHWQGACNATAEQAAWFRGTKSPVYVVVDVDDAGAACGLHRCELLRNVDVSATILAPPHPHGDAAEAIAAGVLLSEFRTPSMVKLRKAAKRYDAKRSKRRGSSDWMGSA